MTLGVVSSTSPLTFRSFFFSQKDSVTKTIEGELFEAFVKAGAVSADNADDHTKVQLARAARTDAGVHAAGNVGGCNESSSPSPSTHHICLPGV